VWGEREREREREGGREGGIETSFLVDAPPAGIKFH
jgi:hypothetical protein